MKKKIQYGLVALVVVVALAIAFVSVQQRKSAPAAERAGIYRADSMSIHIKGSIEPFPTPVPYGAKVMGVLFDGYPQIVKREASQPKYEVRKQKDIMVAMRDGVRVAVDIYRPDVEGERFPAILAWGMWGKDVEEAVGWNWDKPQAYMDTPFWDGTMEAGNYMYTVPRGYVHVIPDPRGVGNSEGFGKPGPAGASGDMYDTIEWIAAQPWCNGKVGMMGPSSYSAQQIAVGPLKPPHLIALHPSGNPLGTGDYFHGVFDTQIYHIRFGRHGNDSAASTPLAAYPPNHDYTVGPPQSLKLPDIQARLQEALNDPDIKYNSKWYSYLKYPWKAPWFFDLLIAYFHPTPPPPRNIDKIAIPTWLGTPWLVRLYIWSTFEAWENLGTPAPNKRLRLTPPGDESRPFASYHDETVRWYDYWLRGIDTGVMDEPPIKLFVMGVNKWKFENEWPLARTNWTKFYLQPGGSLSTEAVTGSPQPETFTQPAPYLDPAVYCLRYTTRPFTQDTEVTGPIALYLEASIDIDDTNWMADLVDVDPDGNRQLLSSGWLKAKFRAADESRSKPYRPAHPRQDPAPVPPGKPIEYAIAMMPTSCIFQKGHSMELIVRNQDDLLSRQGLNGVYMLPFMRTVTHKIYFGKSHLLLPVIPGTLEIAGK